MPNLRNLKIKVNNFKNSMRQNGKKAELRRIKNYLKYKKTVIDSYEEWKILNEPSSEALENQKEFKSFLNNKYLIVVSNEEAKEKVLNQTYTNTDVKVVNPTEFETLLEIESDYIVFVGENISLLPFALCEIEKHLEYFDSNLVYGDNDYLEDGKRVKPDFKPHYAYDTILSKNYFGNFIAVKTKFLKLYPEILKCINTVEPIYNMILRTISKTDKILHVDRILYSKEKDDINTDEQIKCIEEYLKDNKIDYTQVRNGKFEGQYKIDYPIIGNPKISIVIPNMDHTDDLDKAVQSILKSTYTNYEIVIVENNSKKEETFEYYKKIEKKDSRIRVEKMEIKVFNYSAIVNYGVEKSTGDYILLLNNDIEVLTEDWLEQMLMYTQRKDVGICGVKMYFPDRSIQHASVTIGIRGLAGHKYREVPESEFSKDDGINLLQDVSAVTAACCLIKTSTYKELLGFDEKLAVAFNDVDFCLKVRKEDLLIVYNPFVELYHFESKSRGLDDTAEKQKRFAKEYGLFVKRWQRAIGKGDPYFSRNYRLDTDIPTINYNKRMDLI